MAKKDKNNANLIVKNKKASFNYILKDSFEAGILLKGNEVKALREKKANLTDAYASIHRGEIWLKNCHISQYKNAQDEDYEPRRKRKLLMHKKQIIKLDVKLKEKGLTLVPTKLYFKEGKAKVELRLASGKRKYDKRQSIKKRESDRKIRRSLKQKY